MQKKTYWIAAAAGALGLAAVGTIATAQQMDHDGDPARPGFMLGFGPGAGMSPGLMAARRGPGAGMAGVEAFDVDGDGAVTQAEVQEARANRLLAFDTDGDNQLTLAEYQTLWLDAMRENMVDQFQGHDANGDGIVTVAEFTAAYANLIARLDRNGDGVFNAEDHAAMMQHDDDDERHIGPRRIGPHDD